MYMYIVPKNRIKMFCKGVNIMNANEKIELMEKNGFWHYCEVCGKKEFMNSSEAFLKGWSYPGKYGVYSNLANYGFRRLVPRFCFNCSIEKTLYYQMMKDTIFSEIDGKKAWETIRHICDEPCDLV